MPHGLNRSGNFRLGNPVSLPKNFGNGVSTLNPPGNHIGINITDRRVITADGSYNSTPGIAETASGDYLFVYNKGPNHVTTSSRVTRRSLDKGITWGPEVTIWTPISPDPTLFRTPKGALLIEFGKTQSSSGLTGGAYARSEDNGYTWGTFSWFDSPVNGTFFVGPFFNDGPLIYGAGYQPYRTNDGTTDANLFVSTDDGLTWSKKSTVRQGADASISESAAIKVSTTGMFMISRSASNIETYGHFSNDLGTTWGSQIDYTSQVGVIDAPLLIPIPKGILLIGRNAAANQLLAFASYDGGVTFTDRTVLDTYTGQNIDGGYAAALVRSDGGIFVTYYADSNNLRQPDMKSLVLYWK